MYIIDGNAYAGRLTDEIEIERVDALDDMILLLTFSTGEKRLYDATELLNYPAFRLLSSEEAFKTAKIEHGAVVWLDGEIDIAPETLYKNSFAYQEANAGRGG